MSKSDPVGDKHPWEDVPGLWKDEKAFMNWLRSQIRRVWSRHPIKNEYVRARRYKAPLGRATKKNPKGMVWAAKCELCKRETRKFEVDHLEGGYGFSDWNTFTQWARRILWVTFDDIRILCKPCHEIVTHMQRTGLSWEEAERSKEVIAFGKLKVAEQKKQLLALGYAETEISNAQKRKECFSKYIKENNT